MTINPIIINHNNAEIAISKVNCLSFMAFGINVFEIDK